MYLHAISVRRACAHSCVIWRERRQEPSYSNCIPGERRTGGGSCCSRLARAGVQVLKVAAGPVIVTLATVLVAVQQR